MTLKRIVQAIALLAVVTLPRIASAQEVSLSGTLTDSTGAVLPGVTVTALHVESATRSST